jgi:hypothetical protein
MDEISAEGKFKTSEFLTQQFVGLRSGAWWLIAIGEG